MIRHILKSGRAAESVEGYLLQREESPLVYKVLAAKERENDEKANEEKG